MCRGYSVAMLCRTVEGCDTYVVVIVLRCDVGPWRVVTRMSWLFYCDVM
jgi:hypothetical protein